MKRKLAAAVLAALMAMVCLAGCKKEAEKAGSTEGFGKADNDLIVYYDLSVGDTELEDFDTSKYDAEEFKGYLTADVEAYNAEHEFTAKQPITDEEGNVIYEPKAKQPVEVLTCEASDNVLKMQLLYATPADYIAYNEHNEGAFTKRGGTVFETGMLTGAGSDILSNTFADKNGEMIDMAKLAEEKDYASYRYVVLDADATLYYEGILVGAYGCKPDADKNCVNVKAGSKVIIIFK